MTQEDKDHLWNIASNERIAREIIHLALGLGHLFTLHGVPIYDQRKPAAWVNGVRFNIAFGRGEPWKLFEADPDGFWGKQRETVFCAQLINTLGISNDAVGETVAPGVATEWRVYHRLTPEGCAALRQSFFYRECLKTLGEEFALHLTKGTPLYSDYLEVFGKVERSTQS